MATYSLTMHYRGAALDSHRIPVRDLAPSLLATSEAFQEIQQLFDPLGLELTLDIRATHEGSFAIDLILANGSDFLSKTVSLLSGSNATAGANLITYTTVFYSVVKLIKAINSRRIVKHASKDNKVTIHLDDKTTLTTTTDIFRAYLDYNLRQSLSDVVKPVGKRGIDSIEFLSDDNQSVVVESKDYPAFSKPQAKEEILKQDVSEVYLKIATVAFEHGKWKFSLGSNSFFAEIKDKDFLEEVSRNRERFGTADVLKVSLRTVQKIDRSGNLQSLFTIEKVLEHRKGSKEVDLDI